MAPAPRILVADPDLEAARKVGALLRERGFGVQLVTDGSKALEATVLRPPDLVLLDAACPIVDAASFLRIVRSNPRTDRLPVIVTGAVDPGIEGTGGFLGKPLDPAETIARIELLLRRDELAEAGEAVEGRLAHLALADLLQILAANRKSGRLHLESGAATAELHLADGRIRDARSDAASGLKVVFRWLGRREGSFSFRPGGADGPDRIGRTVEDLLLDGMRQADELARLLPRLPPLSAALELCGEPPPLPPPETEVAGLLRAGPRTVAELLDAAEGTDLETARALVALLEANVARPAVAAPAPARLPLLERAELLALRHRLAPRAAPGAPVTGKLLVAGPEAKAIRWAVERLLGLPAFAAAPGAPALGTVGTLVLGEGVRIDLVGFPSAPRAAPLWRPLALGAAGAVLLDDAIGPWLATEAGVTVAVGPADAEEPAAALRLLLGRIARPPA